MKTIISGAQAIVERITALHDGDIPKRLLRKDAKRTGKEFDPNAYFTVLTRLAMIPGHTLDYVYHYAEDFSGNPCLYARPLDASPLGSFLDHRDWAEKHDLSNSLVADGSPQAFFELVAFRRLAGQFYLYWHANYNDLRILTTPSEIEALISEANGEDFGARFTDAQVAAMRAVDPQPIVEIAGDRASVTYCIFTKWGGLVRLKESFRRTAPHLLVGQDILDEVKYDCGTSY